MAGPGNGVWVKVKTKTGQTTRFIANRDGGGSYAQGEVITQSEFNQARARKKAFLNDQGGDNTKPSTGVHPDILAYVVKNGSKVSVPTKKQGMGREEPLRSISFKGTTIHYPGTKDGRELAARAIQAIGTKGYPESLTKHTKNIYFSRQANIYDAAYAKMTGKTVVSNATGGGGDIVFYNGKAGGVKTLAHEMGHNLAQGVYSQNEPPKGTRYHRAQQQEKPVSEYAKVSPAEDFAEAVTFYINAPEALKRASPLKYEAVAEILKGNPNG